MPSILKALAGIVAIATTVFALWGNVIAFTGGELPLVGWDVDGGVGSGLLWFFIANPILFTVGYWVSILLITPIGLLLARR